MMIEVLFANQKGLFFFPEPAVSRDGFNKILEFIKQISWGFTHHVENYRIQANSNMLTFRGMKSLEELNQEAAEINLNIRRLVLNKHCFEPGLEEKIGVVVKITALREQLARVQREIRIRSED
jgi:hypothetical protein